MQVSYSEKEGPKLVLEAETPMEGFALGKLNGDLHEAERFVNWAVQEDGGVVRMVMNLIPSEARWG